MAGEGGCSALWLPPPPPAALRCASEPYTCSLPPAVQWTSGSLRGLRAMPNDGVLEPGNVAMQWSFGLQDVRCQAWNETAVDWVNDPTGPRMGEREGMAAALHAPRKGSY